MFKPNTSDMKRSFYDAAHGEALHRATLRDRVLILYSGATTALIGFFLANKTEVTEAGKVVKMLTDRVENMEAVLMMVPILALGAALLISQHTLIMTGAVAYCRYELFLNDCEVPPWEQSKSAGWLEPVNLYLRTFGEGLLLVVLPGLVTLYTYLRSSNYYLPAIILTGCVALVIVGTLCLRQRLLSEIEESSKHSR